MDMLFLLFIVSVTFTGVSEGAGVLPDNSLNAAVGGSVMFSTTLSPPGTPFVSVSWSVGVKPIITSHSANFTGPEYEGRITLFRSTGSLELRNLTLSDSGEYTVSIIPADGIAQSGQTRLEIHVPVSNVQITASSTDLVEFNSSVHLSCSSSGSYLSFLWLNGSSEVTASERVQLTDGKATLIIHNVTRYDQGPFRCHVFNPVSNGTSNPLNLSISFGPENINLKLFPSQHHYVEGSNISLSCSAVSRPAAQFQWVLNGDLLPDTGPELRLMNIQESQSGNYSCQAFNFKTLRYQTSQPSVISSLTRVANIEVAASSTDLVELISSIRLSCSSSGSFLSFLWLNGSSEVTASERVQLTDGNATLTIHNVTRYDQGPFRCHVFNPVSNGTSDPVNLSISYGPENIKLTISPPQEFYEEGLNISLSCSAVSRPAAQFQWFVNGDLMSDTGPELRLMNIQESQSGNYSCQAFNFKTLRSQTSQSSVVSVQERITGASVKSSTNQSLEGNFVNLTCEAAGTIFTRKWRKDGSDLILTDSMILYNNNRVLSFQPLKRTDKGEYSCNISNPVSSEEAKYNMVVNYGPENVQIKGPREITLTHTLTLNCSAESTPSATYTWKLNDTEILSNSGVLTKKVTELSDSGNYTCEALNHITGRTSSAVHGLSVTVSQPLSCSAGCIAGIVIGCCVVFGVIILAGFCIYKNKKGAKKSSNRNTGTRTRDEGQSNEAYSGTQELNYADIRFFQNKDGGTVQLGLQNNSSEYSQVQVNNRPPTASSPPTYDAHMQRKKTPQPGANGEQTYAQVRTN